MKKRTSQQKAARLKIAVLIISIMVITVLIRTERQQPESVLVTAERRMDACLDSLITALGHPTHTVTFKGEVEQYEENICGRIKRDISAMEFVCEALKEREDTARLSEAKALLERLRALSLSDTIAVSHIRTVTYRDSEEGTHTFIQKLWRDKMTATMTEETFH